MKKLIVIICLLSVAFATQAQKENRIGITAGWQEGYIGDQHLSSLLYKSDVLNLGGIYQSRGDFFFEAVLQVGIGTNQANRFGKRQVHYTEKPDIYGEQDSEVIAVNPFFSRLNAQLSLRGLFQVADNHQLGLAFRTKYVMAGISGDLLQYAQVDIAPSYQYTYGIFDGQIEVAAELPLLSAVVRPNFALDPSLSDETNYFKGYVRTGSAITSINELINPRVRVGYVHTFRNGKELGAYFNIQWTSYSEPRPIRMLDYGIDAVYFF